MEYKQNIKTLIKSNGKASLTEIKKLNKAHQPVLYNLRRLLAENEIRPHIEVNHEIVKSIGITDNELFFTLVNRYEYPQDVLKLINDMCGENLELASQAHNEFIRLCMEKGSKEEFEKLPPRQPNSHSLVLEPAKIESVRRLAIQLMSNMVPGLKERIAFALTSDHIGYRLQLLNSFY